MVNNTPIYLYLKTHNKTNLKYLGMTTQDPFTYGGSGVYWKKHIKKYGNDVSTEILQICETYDQLTEYGKYYSELWDIVESTEFANLVPELGENSSGMKNKFHTEETKLSISKSLQGHSVSQISRKKLSNSLKGNVPWNIGKRGEYSIFSEQKRKERSELYTGENNPFFKCSHTEEFKQTQRENQKRLVSCPYCDKNGAIRIMKRWHFDNCKFKPI